MQGRWVKDKAEKLNNTGASESHIQSPRPCLGDGRARSHHQSVGLGSPGEVASEWASPKEMRP